MCLWPVFVVRNSDIYCLYQVDLRLKPPNLNMIMYLEFCSIGLWHTFAAAGGIATYKTTSISNIKSHFGYFCYITSVFTYFHY